MVGSSHPWSVGVGAETISDSVRMFLMRGDGTPYDILFDLFGGNPIAYPISVMVLFVAYISVFYLIYFFIHEGERKREAQSIA